MVVANSKSNVSASVKQVKPENKKVDPIKVKEIEEVTYRPGYICIWRKRDTDEWSVKPIVGRSKEMMLSSIPPESTQAFIIELDLPYMNL